MPDNREQFASSFMKFLDELYGPCDDAPLCESPIESMLHHAISVVADLKGLTTNISAQHKINTYRVDFLISGWERCPRCVGVSFERSVIVECDGHDFHERTKEQASRDKKRDRVLQMLGYNVFRFTGSEIWKDVFRCADEVVEFILQATETQSIDHWMVHHPNTDDGDIDFGDQEKK